MAGLCLVLLISVALRVYQLDSVPAGTWFDEAQNGLEALRMLRDPSYRPVYIPELTQLPALFFYGIALSFHFFGVSTWPSGWWLRSSASSPFCLLTCWPGTV